MASRGVLEEQLRALAEKLTVRPSLARRVMRELRAYVAEPALTTSRNRLRRWIMGPLPRYFVGVIVVAVSILVAIVWMKPTDFGAGLAFADVQEALRQVKTVVVDVDYPNSPHRNIRVLIARNSNRVRLEWPTGLALVVGENRGLLLDSKRKTAYVNVGHLGDFTASEVLDQLANIEQDAVERLSERTLEGRTLVGFRLPSESAPKAQTQRRVWVDAKTRLPARMEEVPVDPDDPRTASLHVVNKFTFNEPLDESLFSSTPPEGYEVLEANPTNVSTVMMPVPPAPKDKDSASPLIEPGVGIGRARFGMTVEQVFEALGKPDDISDYWRPPAEVVRALSEIEKKVKEEGLDETQRQRLLEELKKKFNVEFESDPGGKTGRILSRGDANGVMLDYDARGFRLTILDDKGFYDIECVSGEPGKRDFAGKTSKGIGMGTSCGEIEKAYGPPDTKSKHPEGVVYLRYESPGMSFSLKGDRLQWMSFRHE